MAFPRRSDQAEKRYRIELSLSHGKLLDLRLFELADSVETLKILGEFWEILREYAICIIMRA